MKKLNFAALWLILAIFAHSAQAQQFQVVVDSASQYVGNIVFNGSTGYAASNGGYWKSLNGGQNWQSVQTGIPGFYDKMAFPAPGTMVTSGADGRISRSTDNGLHWTSHNWGSAELTGLHFANALTGYAVGIYSTVLRTTDGGISWNNQPIPLADAYVSDVLQYNGKIYLAVLGIATNLLKSTNGGINWIDAKVGDGFQSAADICNNGDRFYLGGREDGAVRYPVIYTSTNAGENWQRHSFSFSGTISSIAVSPSNPLNAMAIGCYFDHPTYGNGPLILRTTDGGMTWTEMHWGNSTTIVNSVEATASEYFLAGSGFIIKTAQVVSVHPIATIAEGYELEQNFPNPFNPSTTIRFSLAHQEKASLTVTDMAGRTVAELVRNQTLAAGSYEYAFDANGLSSGVYFYTLETAGFKDVKKMLLVK